MNAFTDEMKDVAEELIAEFGFVGTLHRFSSSTYDENTLRTTPGPETIISVLAVFVEPADARQYEIQSVAEQFSERKWLVIKPTEPGEPKPGDILRAEGRDLKLDGVNPVGPVRDAIYYRAYAER